MSGRLRSVDILFQIRGPAVLVVINAFLAVSYCAVSFLNTLFYLFISHLFFFVCQFAVANTIFVDDVNIKSKQISGS